MPARVDVDAWVRWESDRLNAGYVTRTRSVAALLDEADPRLETRDGDVIRLDPDLLRRIASVCSASERERLRLPITVHFPSDVSDAAYVTDEPAAAVFRRLEGWGEAYAFRDGKMWLPQSLAVDLLLRYEGVLQRLFL